MAYLPNLRGTVGTCLSIRRGSHAATYTRLLHTGISLAFVALVNLSLAAPSPLRAADIDVYNTVKALPYPPYATTGDVAPPNPNYPNILFILDASLSMNAKDRGQTGRRIERLRAAMQQVLSNAEKVNIALMRFSHRNSGGRVIYPMSPIEYAREDAIDIVNNMSLDYWTPTIGAILEGAYYYRGDPVFYGTTRSTNIGNSKHRAEQLTRLSHPESYTGGQIVRDAQCTEDNLDHPSCITERIDGDPVYRTPIHSECQQNYLVLLTDGAATGRVDRAAAESMMGKSCNTANKANTCGVELAEFLATNDQSAIHNGTNTVITHTVGFNTNQSALRNIAAAGKGNYYQSSSADELAAAMTNIIDSVSVPATTLSQPAVSIDYSSLLTHRKDIYLTLFQPVLQPVWPGNLKGYWLDGTLKDYSDPRNQAIDQNSGRIADHAKSQWSVVADGADVEAGGAASRLGNSSTRIVATNYPNGSARLTDEINQLTGDNISAASLGLPDAALSLTESDATNLINWARGTDVLDINGNGNTTEARQRYADALHTTPIVATYGRSGTGAYDSVVYFGTNDGFLNAVNTQDGNNLFSFIPWNLLSKLKHSYVNLPYAEKLYGMDGYLSSWFYDATANGIIDGNSDHLYLYAGLRRGGRDYYALDVTNKHDPRILWTVEGGSGDFKELGQSWSKMVYGKMHHPSHGRVTDVVVFSGGYDPHHDTRLDASTVSMGRAIYIVDAITGEHIWSAGYNGTSMVLPDMKYSIPASPVLLDINADGIFDQLYVGDLGGQIWRFDFAENGSVNGGVIAQLGNDGTDNRLFFSSPDVSILKRSSDSVQIAVAIGSGARHMPLDHSQKNAFYLILLDYATDRTTSTQASHQKSEGYGLRREDGTYSPIVHTDLVDVTDNQLIEGSELEVSSTQRELSEKHGWYINVEASGEKILNPSVTIDNKLVFTSYVPAVITACAAGLGTNNLYTVNILDGTPIFDSDNNAQLTKEDRKAELNVPGISSAPSVVFPHDSNDKVVVMVGEEVAAQLDVAMTKRLYWTEVPDF